MSRKQQKPQKRKKAMPKNFMNVKGWKPTPYNLSMTWDLFDVDRTINMYELMNGEAANSNGPLPLEILQRIYKGDLIIAIRENIIWEKQEYKIRIFGMKYRKINDHSIVRDLPDYHMDFKGDPIAYPVFMRGREEGIHSFKRDGTFKSPWEGITKEWRKYLEQFADDEYELCAALAELSCTAPFTNAFAEGRFKQLRLINQARKPV